MSALASLASGMTSTTVAELLKPMNSSEIITTLETLQASGVNITAFDAAYIIEQFNVTQVTGLLQSNSSTVTSILQSVQPTQLLGLISEFQNTTSTMLKTAAATNNTELYSEGTTLVSLLLQRMNTTFTDSQLLGLFSILGNGAALGTGVTVLMDKATDLIKGFLGGLEVSISIPERLLTLVEEYQPVLFGGYPTTDDIAPSALFTAIFAIFTIIYTLLFLKNWSLGHKFLVTLGLAFYSLIRTIGFILRIVWAKDLTKLELGLTSTIFLVICTVFLPSLNLILAQRYFTWKHPVYGSSRIFMTFMYVIYALVLGVVSMTIVAAAVQINYLLSESHFKMTKQVIQASSILIVLYSLISVVLVFGSWFLPSTSQDKDVLTYQPTWIKSFGWSYFVPKKAAKEAESAVPEDKRSAIRVIQSTDYHYDTITEQSEHESKLHHNGSIVIITVTTLLLFIADIFRCVSTFIEQYVKDESWIFKPVVMYVVIAAFETIVNVLFIFGRIDLRFYKPDAFKSGSASTSSISTNEDVEKDASPIASSNDDAVSQQTQN